MMMISYAQNLEDVMLWRALGHVERGFYIDVGANDPVADSVTKVFYDAGWRGINIEPVAEWFERLQEARPEDINLQLAVGASKGRFDFYEVVGTGLSTINESVATRHAEEHGYELKSYKVPVERLTAICKEHRRPDIHFLKIDVECAERAVLQGLDLKKIRPWIVLVESTLPNSRDEDFEEWESLITGRGYHFVYFDGLNRFYVADEHPELDPAFMVPPNYFDYFKRAQEADLERQSEWLQSEWDSARERVVELEGYSGTLEARIEEFKSEAAGHAERIRELDARHNELLLSLTEKETRVQDANTALAEARREVQNLGAELKAEQGRRRTLGSEVAGYAEKLRESETRHNELLLSLTEKETQVQDANTALAEARRKAENLNVELEGARKKLAERDERLNKESEAVVRLTGELRAAIAWGEELERTIDNYSSVADIRHSQLESIINSRSWRITLPLRLVMQVIRKGPVRSVKALGTLPAYSTGKLLSGTKEFVDNRPALKNRCKMWFRKHPELEMKIRRLAQPHGLLAYQHAGMRTTSAVGNEASALEINLSNLTPRARFIYNEIQAVIEERNKEGN